MLSHLHLHGHTRELYTDYAVLIKTYRDTTITNQDSLVLYLRAFIHPSSVFRGNTSFSCYQHFFFWRDKDWCVSLCDGIA